MDRRTQGLDSDRVSPALCAGTESSGIPLGLLEAARATQCLPSRLLGARRSSAPGVETHPASPAHPHGVLAAIPPAAWPHYIMRTSIEPERFALPWQLSRLCSWAH